MVEVQKKENESTTSLIRRFSHRIQQSGNIPKARSYRFKKRQKSTLSIKKSALWRAKKKKITERLWKLGKIE